MIGDVVIDLGLGTVTVAGVSAPCAPVGEDGRVRIAGDRGPVLRPATFGERSAVVARAAQDRAPSGALAVGLLVTCLVEPPTGGWPDDLRELAEVVALALAGGQLEAASFEETRLRAEGAGLGAGEIDDTAAMEVDRLVAQFSRSASDGESVEQAGVRRFVLVDEPRQTRAAVRCEMAERLLRRGVPARARRRAFVRAGEAAADLDWPRGDSEGLGGSGQPLVPRVVHRGAAVASSASRSDQIAGDPAVDAPGIALLASASRYPAATARVAPSPPVWPRPVIAWSTLSRAAKPSRDDRSDTASEPLPPDAGAWSAAESPRSPGFGELPEAATLRSAESAVIPRGQAAPRAVARRRSTDRLAPSVSGARFDLGASWHRGSEGAAESEVRLLAAGLAGSPTAGLPGELADALAALLDAEADLRGID